MHTLNIRTFFPVNLPQKTLKFESLKKVFYIYFKLKKKPKQPNGKDT